jgi:hypothetical protein
MSYDKDRVLAALVDLGEVKRAAERLGIAPTDAAQRVEAQLDDERIRSETPKQEEYAYRIIKAATVAAKALA